MTQEGNESLPHSLTGLELVSKPMREEIETEIIICDP